MIPPSSPSLWQRTKKLVGPLVRAVIPSQLALQGPYPSYAAALAQSTGYNAPLVAQEVEAAIAAVLEGKAGYERDGTTFDTRPDLPIHAVLKPLLGPHTTIADFGGGLGGLYINAPELFPPGCRKLVIEQTSMVGAGRRLASTPDLTSSFWIQVSRRFLPLMCSFFLVCSSIFQTPGISSPHCSITPNPRRSSWIERPSAAAPAAGMCRPTLAITANPLPIPFRCSIAGDFYRPSAVIASLAAGTIPSIPAGLSTSACCFLGTTWRIPLDENQ